MKRKKKMSPSKKAIIAVLVVLTVFRAWLGLKTPMVFQPFAIHDDMLYANYSSQLLSGHYLGAFSTFTLLKTISPSVLLAFGFLFNISYPAFMTFGYIVAVGLLSFALYKLSRSKSLSIFTYILLLYSPIMFHEENVQLVYRGGYIIIFSLLVISAIVGMYAVARQQTFKSRSFYCWVALATISLPNFYYMKEDSIWIMPFVLVGTAMTIFAMKKNKSLRRSSLFISVVPIISLGVAGLLYRTVNLIAYGEFALVDRSGTNFSKVLNDLVTLDAEEEHPSTVWVSNHMLETAASQSETMNELMPFIKQSWKNWFRDEGAEAPGDFYIWALRDAVNLAGHYTSGKDVEEYYAKIHNELSDAYKSGKLKHATGKAYISPTMYGMTTGEFFDYFPQRFAVALNEVVTYNHNITEVKTDYEDFYGTTEMANLTLAEPTSSRQVYERYSHGAVKIDTGITKIYKLAGRIVFGLAIMGLLSSIITLIIRAKSHRLIYSEETATWLVAVGLFTTAIIILFAVVWFCNFLDDKKIYDYASATIPCIQIFEAIFIWSLISNLKQLYNRIKEKHERKNS
ncbi:hypothetical protein J6S35_02150 [Candidatus Saccharibacteria bacterium]|nr:hypothetical protein [Candidatus Saccharibacteria bacterium]